MCGIAGFVHPNADRPAESAVAAAMCQAIAHRGPDDQGVYAQGPAALGSRRLAIIDLASGHQPIANEDRTIWVVFNGEIYNYRELTTFLQQRGHRFVSQSDTEVIVHAYEEFGDDFPQHLNGMFAIALWDAPKRELRLVRDRMGIKPLYYAQHQGTLIFGSEPKALLAYPGLPRTIDLVALNEYLSFEYVPAPRSIFEGIAKLPPGHTLRYGLGGALRVEAYWDANLAQSESVQPKSADDYADELTALLRDVVRKEMISDVPLGVLLSGGIDSSAIAAMMTELSPGNVKSFSIAFDDPSFDESPFARQVARHLGTVHHELELTSSVAADLLPRIARHMDEPLGDSSLVPTFLLSQFARGHVKAVLGGDGGDELFAGYPTLQAHRLVDYYERLTPGIMRQRIVPWLVQHLPVSHDNFSFDFKLRRFLSGLGVPLLERHHRWLGSFTPEQKQQLLLPAYIRENGTYDVAYRHLQACQARDVINQILYCDMKLYLEGDILTKVDRASMANSLEVRVPFLNHSLVEFVTTLPHTFKLRGMTSKYLLRTCLKGRIPENLRKRGKKGFNMPVAKWLTGPLRPLVQDLFSESQIKRQGYFDSSTIHTLLHEHLTGRHDHRKLLWTLLAFQLWQEEWGAS